MKITLLGTGTSMGVPMIACNCAVCRSADSRDKRTRSSVKIEYDDRIIVVDAGPDFRQQMLASGTQRLNAILFTHEHKDHTAGLDDVRAFNWINREPSHLYGEKRVLDALKREYSYAFKAKDERYPGVPELLLNEIDLNPFVAAGLTVQPIRVFHHKMPVLGFRIGDFSYITDGSLIPDESMTLIRNSRVLVINALRIEPHISHFSLSQALEVIEELQPERAYLTHISHHLGFHEEVSKKLPPNVFLGYDGLEIDI
ncbi:MBL fold metallo-hydrolase [Marinilabilia salmonicolor]|uniref:MBL fold metallo-hydrolase n=1 Tax=Marinilabilia salmonicolor TaxID=989 RepID=UPI000299F43C|nr:MBL fold metallo-hydrolase [Marinilabilia salmonicolor]